MKIMSIITPAAMLTLFCVVITALLAGTNLITRSQIAKLEKKANKDAMTAICEAEQYKEADDGSYFEAVTGGKTTCYIFTETAPGYGGDVKVMTGINPDGTVKSIQVIDVTSETAGLGQNAKNESFTKQFEGKTNGISVVKYGAADNQINAVTGATISSKGVTECVNKALDTFEKSVKGGE